MFSLGFGEILVICVILILVVGPDRLPTVMKGVGKTMRTVREASREIRSTVGLDELMRDDPPRPIYRPPPPATVARVEPLPSETQANAPPVEPPPPESVDEAAVTKVYAPAGPAAPQQSSGPAAGTAVAPSAANDPAQPGSPVNPPSDRDKAGA